MINILSASVWVVSTCCAVYHSYSQYTLQCSENSFPVLCQSVEAASADGMASQNTMIG